MDRNSERETVDSAEHMTIPRIDERMEHLLLEAQKNEITEHFVYQKLLRSTHNPRIREILGNISKDELKHYQFWKQYTLRETNPDRVSVWKYYLLSRLFGLTFGLKLMEKAERRAQAAYEAISRALPAAEEIVKDEDQHEKELVDLIDEERLRYVGSMVLGLNTRWWNSPVYSLD